MEADLHAIDLSDWVTVIEKIAREKYEGKHKAGELNNEYIQKVYKEVTEAAGKGYGKKWATVVNDKGEPSPEVIKMRQNLYKFSMVKNYAMLEELNAYLSGGKDVMRWEEFKQKALQLNKKYNVNYLQAEWQTARQAAHHARNWEQYEADADLFPNLKYKTTGDDRVRKEHEALNGVVAPIKSKFWEVHYPPNGWRCRCYVVQTAEKPSEKLPVLNEKELRPEFRINVGISGEVFKETSENKGKPHPYFALAKSAGSETKKAFEYSKLAAAKEKAYKADNGAIVKVSPFADLSDFEENLQSAKIIADNLGISIEIRGHIDSAIVVGHKNPELSIKGIDGDRTGRQGSIKNFIRNSFAKLKKGGQLYELKETFLVCDCGKIKSISNKEFKSFCNDIYHKMTNHTTVKELYIIYNEKAVKITQNNVIQGLSEIKKILTPIKTQ